MKNLWKRLKRAIAAFNAPEPTPESEKPFLSLMELMDQAERTQKRDPRMLYEDKLRASNLAKKAHLEQNKQIDRYFTSILEKHIDPAILGLYREQGAPVPQLASNIHFFMNEKQTTFGRRITIFFREQKIGDAVFTAKFQEGKAQLTVEEKIKVTDTI